MTTITISPAAAAAAGTPMWPGSVRNSTAATVVAITVRYVPQSSANRRRAATSGASLVQASAGARLDFDCAAGCFRPCTMVAIGFAVANAPAAGRVHRTFVRRGDLAAGGRLGRRLVD